MDNKIANPAAIPAKHAPEFTVNALPVRQLQQLSEMISLRLLPNLVLVLKVTLMIL